MLPLLPPLPWSSRPLGDCCYCDCTDSLSSGSCFYTSFFCADPNSDCFDPRTIEYPDCNQDFDTWPEISLVGDGHCDHENNNLVCEYRRRRLESASILLRLLTQNLLSCSCRVIYDIPYIHKDSHYSIMVVFPCLTSSRGLGLRLRWGGLL